MNSSCIICADSFIPKADIFTTSCGHLFHNDCLEKWIKRSKTCPQCRHKETPKSIHKIFFNIVSSEGIEEDVVTLQSKLDTLKFEVSLKDREINKMKSQYKECNKNCTAMREAIVESDQADREHQTSLLLMRCEVDKYQARLPDLEAITAKRTKLKKQLDGMDHVKDIMVNSKGLVDEMFQHNKDPESLGILLQVAKSELTKVKGTIQNYNKQISNISKELMQLNAMYDRLKSLNTKLSSELEDRKQSLEELKQLQAKIAAYQSNDTQHEDSSQEIINKYEHSFEAFTPERQLKRVSSSSPLSPNKKQKTSPSNSTSSSSKYKRPQSTSLKFRKLAPGKSKGD